MLVDPVNIFGRASIDGYNARSIMGYSFISKRSIWTSSFCRCERPRDPSIVDLGFRLSLSLPCKTAGSMV